jgi:hypothetical protein
VKSAPYLSLNPCINPQYESTSSLQSETMITLRWPRLGIPSKLRTKVAESPQINL